MKSVRETLRGPAGTAIAIGVVVVGAIALYYSLFGGTTAADISRQRTFIDAESLKPFKATLSAGESIPLKSPFTGKATGYEAEKCFWTADGQAKKEPDYVLLNSFRMPPQPEPTFCPVCHCLVIAHNPAPQPGAKPPPTEAEYDRRYRPE